MHFSERQIQSLEKIFLFQAFHILLVKKSRVKPLTAGVRDLRYQFGKTDRVPRIEDPETG
jgi:hypothetical protein